MFISRYLHGFPMQKYIFLVPRLCGAAGECEDDHMCQDSMCVPKCNADEECAQNEQCSKGTCLCKYAKIRNYIILLKNRISGSRICPPRVLYFAGTS